MEERERHIIYDAIYRVSEAREKAPELKGVATGVPGLDDLFYVIEWEGQKPVRKSLGGIPLGCVANITGMPDTGKSLIAEQFAVKQASLGERVCFVTVETTAPFLSVGLEQRARAMGVDFKEIEDRIVILDAASYTRLRDDLPTLLDTLAHIYRTYKVHRTVIDSVTGLFEAKEMLARSIVRALYTFCKKWYQTAIFISQKRSSHELLSAEAAGGYAVGHIVDCTMVLSKELILSARLAQLYKTEIGEIVRLFRIDGCRLCGHDTKIHLMDITELGLVEIGPPLSEVIRSKGEVR
ncbi:MAG: KaiC domain-containing protein [Thermodesulfobacteria bacterium]|nr:KaiC domain-containing protein [Thermodesulfobacteriota bacterium]